MENKFKIIKTEDYVLAVSDETNNSKFKYHLSREQLFKVHHFSVSNDSVSFIPCDEFDLPSDLELLSVDCMNVIAYQPKSNSGELLLPLLPEIVVEDDVRKLALTLYKEPLNKEGEVRTQLVGHGSTPFGFNKWFKAFKKGYKSATKKYSENDLRSAIMQSFLSGVERIENYSEVEYGIIQSLKTSTPKWFVAEIEEWLDQTYSEHGCYRQKLKTTFKNGKAYLVGTYLFE
jgi:hypothetical protein